MPVARRRMELVVIGEGLEEGGEHRFGKTQVENKVGTAHAVFVGTKDS